MPGTEAVVGFSEEEFFAGCLDSAYRIARSIIIREDGGGLEMAVGVGVQMGADGLNPEDKGKVSRELLVRLHGRPLDELKQEQDEEMAREEAEFDKKFGHNNG